MPRTCAFKFRNGQVIRIPAELAYENIGVDLQINRLGDVITIYPARDSMSEVVAALRRMPKPEQVEKRLRTRMPTRPKN
jgi:antitoxin VapB